MYSELTRLPQWLLTEQTPLLDFPELFGRISIAWWLRAWSLYLCKSGFKSKALDLQHTALDKLPF